MPPAALRSPALVALGLFLLLLEQAAGGAAAAEPGVLISAVFYDGYAAGDADEAVQLWNVGASAARMDGWSLDDGEGAAGFPPETQLDPGAYWWLTRDAAAFAASFGHPPDWAWGSPAVAGVGTMSVRGGGPSLANSGDQVMLLRDDGTSADAMVYRDATIPDQWIGPAVQPYRTTALPASNQVEYRKLDAITGQPVPDTDTARDWASDSGDPRLGRRVRYPGWDLENRTLPAVWRENAEIEVVVAPDALHGFLRRRIDSAQQTLDVFAYTFDNTDLAEAVAARAAAGVQVRVLLDGSPAGGFDPTSRWCAATMAAAGASVYWMDAAGTVAPRYRGAHAKLLVVDDTVAVVSTENPGLGSAPYDDFADGTVGRRGAAVAVRGSATLAWVRDLIAADLDPRHVDVRPYQGRDPTRGAPAPDFEPPRGAGGAGYVPVALVPWTGTGTFAFEGVSAPENTLAPGAGLFGLLERTGVGDRVFVVQLYERLHWGTGAPGGPWINPRLEAYVAAARRGASVRVLLDGHFDDGADVNSNTATARWLNRAAAVEGLDLSARLGNPTGAGIHAKVVLVAQSGVRPEAWIHVGSLNGSETSSKANREVALQIEGVGPYTYLRSILEHDWLASARGQVHLPSLSTRAWMRR